MPLFWDIQRKMGVSYDISPEAEKELLFHEWNGNVRELRNYAEYFSYLDKKIIEPEDLPPGFYQKLHIVPNNFQTEIKLSLIHISSYQDRVEPSGRWLERRRYPQVHEGNLYDQR